MYTNFSELPSNSRVWIYQAARVLTEEEIKKVEDWLTYFISTWQSHGSNLCGSFQILYRRFIVLGVDTTNNLPSGCSIDSSVAALKEIENGLGVSLFERTQIPFLEEGGKVTTVNLSEIKQKVESGVINPQSLTFNNLIDTKEKLDNEWLTCAGDTWLSRYFKKSVA
ncbi:MAG: hypothetical protein KTR26_17800 [Flammeovirgaceae bacterium]|nr:hypothetical protein [Flammeovirgaceae bacterium]